ncbi:unnamed protein product [Oncorhynchus mykiss]|uniref:Carbohydrate deacetylase n=1 Tax=Oncorhynchus mykiss TaxID=8022 RepID=A0A060Y321_ONCMY|nr:unnamed protein product [Oncorhynchus mykiss]
MPQPKVKLVVTGDDFGYCPKRNQGIVDCFQAGGISNVSLLVNASSAKEATELAKRHHIPIGLHANLSEGLPVSQGLKRGSTLLNKDGFFHGKMGFRKALQSGLVNMTEVELELRAQVRLFGELMGYLPCHMDGHQHIHVLPGMIKSVKNKFSFTTTANQKAKGLLRGRRLGLYINIYKYRTKHTSRQERQHNTAWPDVYLGLTTMGHNMSVPNLRRAFSHALERDLNVSLSPPGGESKNRTNTTEQPVLTAELMVHPGYPSHPQEGGCGEGPDDFSQSADRQQELTTLKDPALLAFYTQERVQLCAFRDL